LDAFAANGTGTAESGSEPDSNVPSDTTPNDDQEASSDDAAATDTSEGQTDTPAWNDVAGIGDGTAEKLIERGFDSPTAVREATDEELAAVPNIGTKTIDRLRGYVE
jgi:ERCC4-type nuclease